MQKYTKQNPLVQLNLQKGLRLKNLQFLRKMNKWIGMYKLNSLMSMDMGNSLNLRGSSKKDCNRLRNFKMLSCSMK